MSTSNLSVAALRKIIDRDWFALERACDVKQPAGRMLENALAAAIVSERQHRRSRPGYRIGVELAARSVVLRLATDPQCSKNLPPEELMQMRAEVAYCYAIRRLLGDAAEKLAAHTVSYSDDIAS
jgi:hypothetical protein